MLSTASGHLVFAVIGVLHQQNFLIAFRLTYKGNLVDQEHQQRRNRELINRLNLSLKNLTNLSLKFNPSFHYICRLKLKNSANKVF